MTLKQLVAVGLGVASLSAALDRSTFPVVLSTVSAIFLALGFRMNSSSIELLGVVFVYYPLALALSVILLAPLSFTLAAALLDVYAEKLSFESDLSFADQETTGIDLEAKTRLDQLRKVHTKRLIVLFSSVVAIMFVSALISAYTPAALEVVFFTLGLLVIAAIYVLKSQAT